MKSENQRNRGNYPLNKRDTARGRLKKGIVIIFLILLPVLCSANSGRYWVFFTDKLPSAGKVVTFPQRNIDRRARLGIGFDQYDIPVAKEYIDSLVSLGCRVHSVSRYLNAVSCYIPAGGKELILRFPFVRAIKPVGHLVRGREPVNPVPKSAFEDTLYGVSYAHLARIFVPEAHRSGLTGRGVLVGILDTGFDTQHSAFRALNILATYDFIHNDTIVDNEEGESPEQHSHGTATLSALAGYLPGELVGVAYEGTLALGKTELVDQEIEIEEDNWVSGIEWAESLGCRVVSSSLGYYTWDDGTGYTYFDMDGNRTIVSIAADIAASRGVVVVNSAGNENVPPNYRELPDVWGEYIHNPENPSDSAWGCIIAPGDGDSVVTVGALDENDEIASFSSTGPTADYRIKPDVSAPGVNIACAMAGTIDEVGAASGTSLAAPLVAGVVALMLQENPSLSPPDIMESLHSTSDRFSSPNFSYGWGKVIAPVAAGIMGGVYVRVFEQGTGYPIQDAAVQITSSDTTIFLYVNADGMAAMPLPDGEYTARVNIPGYRVEERDFSISPGVREQLSFGMMRIADQILVYPNPFSDSLIVLSELDTTENAPPLLVLVYSSSGQLIFEREINDSYFFIWNGKNSSGNPVADGIYIVYAKRGKTEKLTKVAKITKE